MDSVVGSLVLAYYYTSIEEDLFVPVLNCNEDDFEEKFEIVKHLEDCEIPLDNFIFYDEFRA